MKNKVHFIDTTSQKMSFPNERITCFGAFIQYEDPILVKEIPFTFTTSYAEPNENLISYCLRYLIDISKVIELTESRKLSP